jgi:hypothetical protein
MKNTISNSIMSKTQRICLGFMVLAAFGISTAYAQDAQTEETVKVLRVKKNAPKHETRTVKGRVTDSATGTPMGGDYCEELYQAGRNKQHLRRDRHDEQIGWRHQYR